VKDFKTEVKLVLDKSRGVEAEITVARETTAAFISPQAILRADPKYMRLAATLL